LLTCAASSTDTAAASNLPPAKRPGRAPIRSLAAVSFLTRRATSRSGDGVVAVLTGHRAAIVGGVSSLMITTHDNTIVVGNFFVSPLTTATDSGRFAASAVIRSGHGRGTHHRVLRFVPRFSTRDGARRYAVEHGVAHASALLQQQQET
jgi:hypothetical protein